MGAGSVSGGFQKGGTEQIRIRGGGIPDPSFKDLRSDQRDPVCDHHVSSSGGLYAGPSGSVYQTWTSETQRFQRPLSCSPSEGAASGG